MGTTVQEFLEHLASLTQTTHRRRSLSPLNSKTYKEGFGFLAEMAQHIIPDIMRFGCMIKLAMNGRGKADHPLRISTHITEQKESQALIIIPEHEAMVFPVGLITMAYSGYSVDMAMIRKGS